MREQLTLRSEKNCGYCGVSLNPIRESQWDGKDDSQHYKQADCDKCGVRNWQRVDFHGSGHDVSDDSGTIESI